MKHHLLVVLLLFVNLFLGKYLLLNILQYKLFLQFLRLLFQLLHLLLLHQLEQGRVSRVIEAGEHNFGLI